MKAWRGEELDDITFLERGLLWAIPLGLLLWVLAAVLGFYVFIGLNTWRYHHGTEKLEKAQWAAQHDGVWISTSSTVQVGVFVEIVPRRRVRHGVTRARFDLLI